LKKGLIRFDHLDSIHSHIIIHEIVSFEPAL
jgi:hypothetical protein